MGVTLSVRDQTLCRNFDGQVQRLEICKPSKQVIYPRFMLSSVDFDDASKPDFPGKRILSHD